ncbi:amidohydrolase family protein [uncultured Hymenobacter sp.]|uniref:amidohydrolase family protein n=1 Tax=uncultured Hymenobacter sp. TaxID=170016 RepID=UPI0035CA2B21
MRFIGLEEHYWDAKITDALHRLPPDQRDDSVEMFQTGPLSPLLLDLGEDRLRQMDLLALDMMVLSVTAPGTQILSPAEAVPLARQANDALAATVRAHPDRYAGWATLPTPHPQAAVEELERAVQALGLCGPMLHGRSGDKYLDHPDFRPLLAKAAALNVPIYLHPQIAPRPVRALYYDGFDAKMSAEFASSGWGWHIEAGVTALRLIVAGVFDELPNLQFVLGHWGETLLFFLDRANEMSPLMKHKKTVAEYFRQNFYVTGSGIVSTPYLLKAVAVLGADRVMFSTDYPFQLHPEDPDRKFIENAPLPIEDIAKIAHGNAERLLNIKP